MSKERMQGSMTESEKQREKQRRTTEKKQVRSKEKAN